MLATLGHVGPKSYLREKGFNWTTWCCEGAEEQAMGGEGQKPQPAFFSFIFAGFTFEDAMMNQIYD